MVLNIGFQISVLPGKHNQKLEEHFLFIYLFVWPKIQELDNLLWDSFRSVNGDFLEIKDDNLFRSFQKIDSDHEKKRCCKSSPR